jgi:adsorption protein B
MDWGALIDASAFAVRELALFAAAGFLILGASDLLVDILWIALRLRRLARRDAPISLATLPPPERPGRLAVFIPAWQEAAVIGQMLRHSCTAWASDDLRLYVGSYPNDPETAAAVEAVSDHRIRLVTGPRPGPTTKADCLNTIWRAMLADETAEGTSFKAILLHDAEDVVHSAEPRLFDRMIERFDLVQLPVMPLIDVKRRGVSATYLDEFAESHGKEMVVRQALGAGLPSAGVGCAISREAMALLAGADPDRNPFATGSITEDYEIGLKLHALGCRSAFVRLPAAAGGAAIVTRGHFPSDWREAVAQKSRWMAGIALAGWDRLGWSGGAAERWMRLRDRQGPLAALLLCAAYAAMLAGPLVASAAQVVGRPVELLTPTLAAMMQVAMLLLAWRLVMRFGFVAAGHGWREGLRAVPRVVTSNAIAMLSAREALGRYARARRTGEAVWGKTSHVFPAQVPAE